MAHEAVEEHYHAGDSSGSMVGVVMAILIAVFVIALFFIFGSGFLRGGGQTTAPSISVPEQVDVNVDGGAGQQ